MRERIRGKCVSVGRYNLPRHCNPWLTYQEYLSSIPQFESIKLKSQFVRSVVRPSHTCYSNSSIFQTRAFSRTILFITYLLVFLDPTMRNSDFYLVSIVSLIKYVHADCGSSINSIILQDTTALL